MRMSDRTAGVIIMLLTLAAVVVAAGGQDAGLLTARTGGGVGLVILLGGLLVLGLIRGGRAAVGTLGYFVVSVGALMLVVTIIVRLL